MKFTSVLSTAALAASAMAINVDCLVNGDSVATVDLDTGVCPFTIPAEDPVVFQFVSVEEFDVTAYYVHINGTRHFNDVRNAGRVVEVEANLLFGQASVDLFQIHQEKTAPANSTAAIRRRLLNQVAKRDDIDNFVAFIETLDGTAVPGATFAVVEAAGSSSAEGTVTETDVSTTVVTITSCSNDVCTPLTVPATPSEVTYTTDEVVTYYTTYCPLETTVTITSCSENKCSQTYVPYTPSLTTGTVNGQETVYYTYCPLTTEKPSPQNLAAESTIIEVSSNGEGSKFSSSLFALLIAPLVMLI